MRGAGCTVNDLWDQEYDKQVRGRRLRRLAPTCVARACFVVRLFDAMLRTLRACAGRDHREGARLSEDRPQRL